MGTGFVTQATQHVLAFPIVPFESSLHMFYIDFHGTFIYIYIISCVENMTEHPSDEMYLSDDELLTNNKTDSVAKNVSIIW
jgi:hypothetical protein